MNRRCLARRFAALAALTQLTAAATARAGSSGLFTTYGSDVDRGEIEVMIMNDLTRPSTVRRQREGFGDYVSHMLEIEYGASDQLALEVMAESFEDLKTGDHAFTGYRFEARYRLFRRRIPLNPMLYVEYEDLDPRTRYKMEVSGWVDAPYASNEARPGRERILESRLVLSESFGPVMLAANGVVETDLAEGTTAFGYSAGFMWMSGHHHGAGRDAGAGTGSFACPMHPEVVATAPETCPRCGMQLTAVGATRSPTRATPSSGCSCRRDMPGCGCGHCGGNDGRCSCSHGGSVSLGFELYGGLGDTRRFALMPSRQEHYLGPTFVLHLTSRWMAHAQVGIGLTRASDQLARLNVAYEF